MCDAITKLFSTVEIAAALGVGESSVKRWIDAGSLAAEKTPGGHRRVTLSAFYDFLRATGKNLIAPEAVGLGTAAAGESKTLLEVCQTSLQNGDVFAFESALQLLRLSEPTTAAIIDKTIYPAFQAVRAVCHHPSEECLVLHRAITIAQSALRLIRSPADKPSSEARPRVVLADIGYEVDGIPTLFAEASVWDQAHCLQLGTNIPATVIEGAIEAFNASVLWLSASGPCRSSATKAAFESILARAKRRNIKVVIFGDATPRNIKGVERVASFGEFREFISALV